jgi:hypothetical protein
LKSKDRAESVFFVERRSSHPLPDKQGSVTDFFSDLVLEILNAAAASIKDGKCSSLNLESKILEKVAGIIHWGYTLFMSNRSNAGLFS